MAPLVDSPCRVCGNSSSFLFEQTVLRRPVRYFDCARCGYVQTEQPYWLEEAYSSAINDVDTGIMMRNGANVSRVVMTLLALRKLRGRVVDEAGGYGILVRLLRDTGVDAYWADKYCENLLARGFEAGDSDAFDLVTAFEVFEHFTDPLEQLRRMLGRSPNVLITTELIETPAAPQREWWYFGTEHGQHIGFFRIKTLKAMATALGCHVGTDGRSVHLFSRKPIPLTWRSCLDHPRWSRSVARLRLRSKTMSDFQHLRVARLNAHEGC